MKDSNGNRIVREDALEPMLHFIEITREGVLEPINGKSIREERQDYFVAEYQEDYYYSIS